MVYLKFYLGIDGGGTKTKVTIIDSTNTVVYENVGGPSSIDTVSAKQTLENIQHALEPFYQDYPDIIFESVFAGLGGIVFESDFIHVENLLKKLPGVRPETIVKARNDMENALYSGLCFKEGITLIAGTGMVAFGKDTHGTVHKSGGWGYKIGDEGSGYDLGFQALKHVIRALDSRCEMTDFGKEIAIHLNLDNATDIVPFMDRYSNDRTKIASLAPFVTQYANLGNPYAKKIVDIATSELAQAVEAVYKKLRLNRKILVVVGSVGNVSGYFKDQLYRKINQIDKEIEIIQPQIDPSLAAAIIALQNKTS